MRTESAFHDGMWRCLLNRVAILIDGGFFLKRLPIVRPKVDCNDAEAIRLVIRQLVATHLHKLNEKEATKLWRQGPKKDKPEYSLESHPSAQLYRCFYYDAVPYDGTGHKPISGTFIDYDKSDEAILRRSLLDCLRRERSFALRLGRCVPQPEYMWSLKPSALKQLIQGKSEFGDLKDSDFQTSIRQKGVDIRLGIDMSSIALKKQANIFVLVTGDADFVPAAKHARREGCKVILDPLYLKVADELFEHIDGLTTGLPRPNNRLAPKGSAKKTVAKSLLSHSQNRKAKPIASTRRDLSRPKG